MNRRSALLGLIVLGAMLGVLSSPLKAAAQSNEPFEFALIGDYPYFERDYVGMPHLLEDLRNAEGLSWVLHVGDLHNPRNTDCSRELYEERRRDFLGLGQPFVLTPGDNDWLDCEDEPLAFLEMVRDVFYPDPSRVHGGEGFAVRSQSEDPAYEDLVENVIWERGGVVFATMHMVGASENGRLFENDRATRLHLIEAGEAWLDEAFRVAQASDARGVFVAMQVDPWPTSGNLQRFQVIDPGVLDQAPVFRNFKARLVEHAREFKRPIVVAHGDTHVFRVDKPLHDEPLDTLQNVTRVESFGSPHGHWVRVRVEPDRPEVFSFREEWVDENLYTLVAREDRTDGYKEDDRLERFLIPLRIVQAIPTVLMLIGVATVLRLLWLGFRKWRTSRG